MGKSCCAIGCTNCYSKGCGLSFYRFPEEPAKRAQWIAAVSRKNWQPTEHAWICSAHFVGGAKSIVIRYHQHIFHLYLFMWRAL